MEISLYNEDTSDYFGIVDLPDDIASFLMKDAEVNGYTVEDYIRQLIMEIVDARNKDLG
jgi:hypothetical protein